MRESKKHLQTGGARRFNRGLLFALICILALTALMCFAHIWFSGRGREAAVAAPAEVNQMLTDIAANSSRDGSYEVQDLTEQFESDTTSSVQTLSGNDVTVQVYAYKGADETNENFDFFYETLSLSAPDGEKKTEKKNLLILESETDYIVLAKQDAQVIYAQSRAEKKSELDSILHEMGVRY